MANSRIGGIIQFKIDGELFLAKGNFTYNLGVPKKEMIVGADGVHGFKETPQVSFIEGAITDTDEVDLENQILKVRDATITLELANGKLVTVEEAVYAGEGNVTSEEGEISVRFEGKRGREHSA